MAKITRKTLLQFGVSGPSTSFGQFGSKVAGVPQTTQDPTVIQQLAAWVNGWQNAVVAANKAAYLEDMNGWCFVHSYMSAYMLQQGLPEWDSGTTYYTNSVVQGTAALGNAGQWFNSLQDSSIGNAPPVSASNAFWLWINPPAILDGGVTVNAIPKVSAAAPGKVVNSILSEVAGNIVLASGGIKFANATVQTTAAQPVSVQNDVTGSRAYNTTYQNTTGKAMFVAVASSYAGGSAVAQTDGSLTPTTTVAVGSASGIAPDAGTLFFIVLPGNYYKMATSGGVVLDSWIEWN